MRRNTYARRHNHRRLVEAENKKFDRVIDFINSLDAEDIIDLYNNIFGYPEEITPMRRLKSLFPQDDSLDVIKKLEDYIETGAFNPFDKYVVYTESPHIEYSSYKDEYEAVGAVVYDTGAIDEMAQYIIDHDEAFDYPKLAEILDS